LPPALAANRPASRHSGPTWKQFLPVQARGIIAADFVHVDTGAAPHSPGAGPSRGHGRGAAV